MTDINSKLVDWFQGGNTGASSKCMAFHLTGRKCSGDYPHDASDFGRCLGLLDAVPELRSLLPKMASVNAYWAALAPKWADIEAMEPAKRTYTIRNIIRPIEDANSAVVRMGGATIRFGAIRP